MFVKQIFDIRYYIVFNVEGLKCLYDNSFDFASVVALVGRVEKYIGLQTHLLLTLFLYHNYNKNIFELSMNFRTFVILKK